MLQIYQYATYLSSSYLSSIRYSKLVYLPNDSTMYKYYSNDSTTYKYYSNNNQ